MICRLRIFAFCFYIFAKILLPDSIMVVLQILALIVQVRVLIG